MSSDARALHEQLKRDWCDMFQVDVLPNGTISLATAFTFGDGDSYPILIEHVEKGWRITDRGLAVSHLQFAELELTDARQRQIERFADEYGWSFVDGALTRETENGPDIDDISAFVKLLALIDGLPLHVTPERDAERFRTRAQRQITTWLPDPDVARTGWVPPRTGGELFPADMWLPADSEHEPVVTFFAATTARAERSMAFVGEYAKWDLGVKPLLVHDGSLPSKTIDRAQIVLDDMAAVVKVNERAEQTGYLPLHHALRDAGVVLVSCVRGSLDIS